MPQNAHVHVEAQNARTSRRKSKKTRVSMGCLPGKRSWEARREMGAAYEAQLNEPYQAPKRVHTACMLCIMSG